MSILTTIFYILWGAVALFMLYEIISSDWKESKKNKKLEILNSIVKEEK